MIAIPSIPVSLPAPVTISLVSKVECTPFLRQERKLLFTLNGEKR